MSSLPSFLAKKNTVTSHKGKIKFFSTCESFRFKVNRSQNGER